MCSDSSPTTSRSPASKAALALLAPGRDGGDDDVDGLADQDARSVGGSSHPFREFAAFYFKTKGTGCSPAKSVRRASHDLRILFAALGSLFGFLRGFCLPVLSSGSRRALCQRLSLAARSAVAASAP